MTTAFVFADYTWTESFGLITEPDRGFTDHLQLALDGRYRLRVRTEFTCVHAQRKLLDGSDGGGNVA